MKRLALIWLVFGALVGSLLLFPRAAASPGTTERVSVDSAGNQAPQGAAGPYMSADGRYVVFDSLDPLSPGDANYFCDTDYDDVYDDNCGDTFVHDRQTGATELASVDSAGNQGDDHSFAGPISADGRYVVFWSSAHNLVSGDTNARDDVFVHDRQTGLTERVSVDSAGNQGNGTSYPYAVSADGRYVVLESFASNLVPGDTNNMPDVFVHDRQTGATERVSVDSAGNQADDGGEISSVSADGHYVAFSSGASNLVPGDTNFHTDIFVHDRQTGVTERVSVDSAGNQANGGADGPYMSADGRYVAFSSYSSNLVPGDTNGETDVFVHDRQTGLTERVSVDSAGNEGNGESRCRHQR